MTSIPCVLVYEGDRCFGPFASMADAERFAVVKGVVGGEVFETEYVLTVHDVDRTEAEIIAQHFVSVPSVH